MKRALITLWLVTAAAGCGSSPPPTAAITDLQPDSAVNMNVAIEVKAADFGDARMVPAIEAALRGLATNVARANVKPGTDVKWVQVVVHVNSPADAHDKLGQIRFPLDQFVKSGGNLDAADTVALRGYGAAKSFCDDTANSARAFCQTAAIGWT